MREFICGSSRWLTAAPIKDDAPCHLHVMYTGVYIMHTSCRSTYLLCACVRACPAFLKWVPWANRVLRVNPCARTPLVCQCVRVCVCGRRRLRSKVSELGGSHTRRKHFLDPVTAAVWWSAAVMPIYQHCPDRDIFTVRDIFRRERLGLIWLSVSKGWTTGTVTPPAGSQGLQQWKKKYDFYQLKHNTSHYRFVSLNMCK